MWTRGAMLAAVLALGGAGGHTLVLDMHRWQVVHSDSGPVNYYTVVNLPDGGAYLHSAYRPPLETTSLGYKVPEAMRHTFHHLHWRWRARILPKGGNECAKDKGDSAAVLYVTWRRDLKWYALKYVWSAVGPKGAVCDKKSNWFRAQQTVILETGGPVDVWKSESIDLDSEFRKHFEHGNPKASVPPLMGLGLMSDGDQTHSKSSADFADFVLTEN